MSSRALQCNAFVLRLLGTRVTFTVYYALPGEIRFAVSKATTSTSTLN